MVTKKTADKPAEKKDEFRVTLKRGDETRVVRTREGLVKAKFDGFVEEK